MDELKEGDCIIASWKTPSGQLKKVRGEVLWVKGDKVRFAYRHDSQRGRTINFEIKETTKPLAQVTRVEREPGEVPVTRSLTRLVYAMVGKEPPPRADSD